MNIIKTFLHNPERFYGSLLIFMTSIVFLSSLGYEFIFLDDTSIIYDGYERISSFEKIPEAFTANYLGGHYYRPFTVITFILNALVSGQHPFSYHALNLLIHVLTTFFIYRILIWAGNKKHIAAITAMIFGLSAIHINAVGWIAGRADLLTGFFGSVTFLFLLKHQSRLTLSRICICFICLMSAILSKESAVILPFLILFYFLPNKTTALNKKVILSAAMLSTIIFYLFLRSAVSGSVQTDKVPLSMILTNLRVMPETLTKFFFPFDIDALPDFSPVTTSTGVLIFLVLLFLPAVFKKINKKIYFSGIAGFILLMIPGMFFRTMAMDGYYYWDCRSYLPLIAMTLPVAEILNSLIKRFDPKIILNIVYIFIFMLAMGTIYHLQKYSDGNVFWSSVAEDYPERYLSYIGLFNYNKHYGNKTTAESNINEAVRLNPENVSNRIIKINFLNERGKYEKTFQTVIEGLKYSPDNLSLIQHLVRLTTRLNIQDELPGYIFLESSNKNYYSKLSEFLKEEAKKALNDDDTDSYNFLLRQSEKADSLFINFK